MWTLQWQGLATKSQAIMGTYRYKKAWQQLGIKQRLGPGDPQTVGKG